MIRIGRKTKIGKENKRYYASGAYGYVSIELWGKLLDFMYTDPTRGFSLDPTKGFPFKTIEERVEERVEELLSLNPDKSLLWQFSALTPDYLDYIRMIAPFNVPYLSAIVPISWFGAIRFRINVVICKFLNLFF
jgi:hypothetical protein